ncbi:hypothetical protein G7Y79_00028g062870 [Physcia stellaris]|nr:hypothetical protein G7Y79_00028g062870 [Physcia stellaris]
MLPLNATLAVTGVYTVLIVWIFIAAVTWSWWTPFKEVQSLARGGITAPLPKSVPDALLATLILLFTQGCWCIFTFGQIITLYMATDSSKDPHRNAYLTNALALWSLISVLCIIGGIKLAAITYDNLRQIGLFPKEFRPRLRRGHPRANDIERPARRLSRYRDNFHADIESTPGYGTFYNPGEDQGYDDETEFYYPSNPHRSRTLASRSFVPGCRECEESMLLERAPERGDPHRSLQGLSHSPLYESPMNGSQSEVSDADDELEEVGDSGAELERARG